MSDSYVVPGEVISPKRQWSLKKILYDKGPNGPAVAVGFWEAEPVLAMRWNGNDQNPIGNPQSRGLATWFIVPNEFKDSILRKLQDLEPENEVRAREFFADAIVLTNTIPMPDRRMAIQNAVLQGLGQRLETEQWRVRIFEPQEGPEYVIKISGPNDFRWERTFFGPVEQNPDFIREEVRRATQQA